MTKQWDADDKGTLRTKGLLGRRTGVLEEDGMDWQMGAAILNKAAYHAKNEIFISFF